MLPEIKKIKLQDDNFPTKWQAVIFRNYGLVRTKKIAEILKTDVKTVKKEAFRLGLKKLTADYRFNDNGYITIIRNNWFLLPYEQIRELLGFSLEKFDFIIKEEDFLWVKLGNFKPECAPVYYSPLSEEDIVKTKRIAKTVRKNLVSDYGYFDFFNNLKVQSDHKTFSEGTRLIHGYITPCGDVFSVDSKSYLSDELLGVYADNGINAMFIHGVLSALSYYPFKPQLSEGYKKRRKNLKDLIDRADKFGIKIYLYLNEPRSLPLPDFERFPHLLGHKENGYGALCFEQQEVKDYLYNAVKDLAVNLEKLGGILSITMSENLTHCNSLRDDNCPHCKNIPAEKSASDVNNVMMKALRDSGTGAELIANLWGWSQFMGWTDKQLERGIKLLDKDISVLTVSEYDLDIKKGGVKNKIIDYSISNPGPSKVAIKTLKLATKYGHKTYAKTQTSNSWECSIVPYIPAYELIKEHIDNLNLYGVKNFMLSWTLGGYPSPSLDLVNAVSGGKSLDEWYSDYYGSDAQLVKQAVSLFCKGFKQYPFDVNGLYFSPKNLGPANLLSLDPEEKESAMVSYSFDDYAYWVGPYGYKIYTSQMKKLVGLFKESIDVIEKGVEVKSEKISEMLLYMKVAYVHFLSDLYQTEFSFLKRNLSDNKKQITSLLKRMRKLTVMSLEFASKDSKIAYEASNHYFYVQNNLLEKLINIDNLLEKLK